MDNTPLEPAAALARNNPGLYQSTTSMGVRHARRTGERMAIFCGAVAETFRERLADKLLRGAHVRARVGLMNFVNFRGAAGRAGACR
jgi:hypothetical protein